MLFFETIHKILFRGESEEEYRLTRGMKVGKNCHIYSWDTIDGGHPYLISIGDNVTISSNVTILTHDASTNVVGCGTKIGKVTIGNNVFIGTRAIVLCNLILEIMLLLEQEVLLHMICPITEYMLGFRQDM